MLKSRTSKLKDVPQNQQLAQQQKRKKEVTSHHERWVNALSIEVFNLFYFILFYYGFVVFL